MIYGKSKIIVANKYDGIICNTIPFVAIDKRTGKALEYGEKALNLYNDNQDMYSIINPFETGKITSFSYGNYILQSILKELCKKYSVVKPSILLSVPIGITDVEEKAYTDIFLQAGARDVLIIDSLVCSALAVSTTSMLSNGYLIVDLGAGVSQIGTISIGRLIDYDIVNTSGDMINEHIIQYLKDKYRALITKDEAEMLKNEIGSSNPLVSEIHRRVQAKDIPSNSLINLLVSSKDIEYSMENDVNEINSKIIEILKKSKADLIGDIIDNGIHLVGGGAQIRNLDNTITHLTGVNTYIYRKPSYATINGLIKILKNLSKYKPILEEKTYKMKK